MSQDLREAYRDLEEVDARTEDPLEHILSFRRYLRTLDRHSRTVQQLSNHPGQQIRVHFRLPD